MMEREFFSTKNYLLTEYNSMRLKTYAEDVYIPFTRNGIKQAMNDISDKEPVILGAGSNTIFSCERCQNTILASWMLKRIQYDNTSIIAESGVTLSRLAWFALEHSLRGFEYLEDIPGSVGGALCMNAGTYEDSISKQVQSVTIYDFADHKIKILDQEKLASYWGKRDSYFQHFPCFILQCTLNADQKGDYAEILDHMLDIKRKRYLKQPRNYPSAGSVFKRPYIDGQPAYVWKLLDEAGLRGYRIGDAQVSQLHPGFIVNLGNATGQDVINLLNHCKKTVFDRFGIQLEEEWKII